MPARIGAVDMSPEEFEVIGHLLHPYDVQLKASSEGSDLTLCKENADPESCNFSLKMPYPHERRKNKGARRASVYFSSQFLTASLRIFERVMERKIAPAYLFSTRLPFQYNQVLGSLAKRLLRMAQGDSEIVNHLRVEKDRCALFDAFLRLGFALERRTRPTLLVTHDVDTKKGLAKALKMKAVEQSLDVTTSWFFVSHQYSIPDQIAADLGANSMVGSHDTKHDGRLIQISDRNSLVTRLKKSKAKLEDIFEKEVDCFRAPLLQFSRRIAWGLQKAGYKHDFSLPTWEPAHPLTMTGFGVEAVHPFQVGNLTEVPLTLFQDQQVLQVLGLSTKKAIRFWVKQARAVKAYGGDIVLLVHPENEFSRDLGSYRRLLLELLEVSNAS